MTAVLTFDAAVSGAVDEITLRGADFVYNPDGLGDCLYVAQSDSRFPSGHADGVAVGSTVCGCLVGGVLTRTGFMTDYIANTSIGVATLIHEGTLNVDSTRTSVFLTVLQSEQDTGKSWGDALVTALRDAFAADDFDV